MSISLAQHQLRLTKSQSPGWGDLSDRDRALFARLPADYREFLERYNGGFVAPECDSYFSIAMERRDGATITSISEQNRIEEFFAVMPSAADYAPQYGEVPASVFHEHWYRHVEEGFLPVDVVAIASCTQSCLLACSLNREDYGSIYYWEWYWRYPWFSEFFDRRIEAALRQFPEIEEIRNDSSHPRFQEAFNACNYATLIRVADSFSDLVRSLQPASDTDA